MCGSTCFGRVVGRGLGGLVRPRPTTLLPLRSNGKTRGCWCICKLLMMGVEAPETRWDTHKRQVINLWQFCIWVVNLFESFDDARTCKHQISVCSQNHTKHINTMCRPNVEFINPLNAELNSIYHLLVLLGNLTWRTPPTAHSNLFQLSHDSGR
jgi:hypothetical protein